MHVVCFETTMTKKIWPSRIRLCLLLASTLICAASNSVWLSNSLFDLKYDDNILSTISCVGRVPLFVRNWSFSVMYWIRESFVRQMYKFHTFRSENSKNRRICIFNSFSGFGVCRSSCSWAILALPDASSKAFSLSSKAATFSIRAE